MNLKMVTVSVATTPDATLATPRVLSEGPYSHGRAPDGTES